MTAAEAPSGWGRRMARYAVAAALVSGGLLGVGWPLAGEEGRRALGLAVAITLPVQLSTFGLLAARGTGTPGFLVVWGGSTLVRFAVIGAAAFLLAGTEGVDLVVALLAIAGLFFVLLLLEPWALRERDRTPTQG